MAHISEAAPLQIERFYTGLYTYRNPLVVPIRQVGRRIIELYDAISDGLNMEPSNRLTLARRPGYTAVSSAAPFGQVLWFHTFKPTSFPGQVYQVMDTTTHVEHFQPAGVNYEIKDLVAKTTPALTNFASVGAYDYMAQELFTVKWDSPGGPQGVTEWGIDMNNSAHTLTPRNPSHIDSLPSPNPYWIYSNPTTLTVDLPRPQGNVETLVSQWLTVTGWGITFTSDPVPGAYEISGFQVMFTATESIPIGTSLNVRMMRNGSLYGTYRTVTLPTQTPVTLGSPGDLWDGAWTLKDINQDNFGVAFQAVNSSAAGQVAYFLSNITLDVFLTRSPGIGLVAPPTSPGLTAETGYLYKYCYGNSHSGHISSPTPPSIYQIADGVVKPVNQAVEVFLQPSLDPQVTDIHVYRTSDGGGNPYFELPNSPVPNGTTSIIDNAPDNELQIANICPDPHFNDRPPGGAIDPVWYAGRLWMHRAHQLFFASGPDITVGNEQEAWYPVYTFSVPSAIVRKFPTPNGLLLVCVDDILIVRGISTASFTVNDFMKDIGMRTWTAGDSDGTNVYIYTSDRQFLLINANGLTSISGNIADVISAVDPTLAYVSQFRYTALENWIFVGDGSTYLYPYNQELQAWATKQAPVNGVGAIGMVESSPGVFQFWRSRPVGSSTITFRDRTTFADEGVAYPCYATFGPIPVADFLTVAQLRDIVLTTVTTTSQVILSVLANEVFPVADSQFQILQVSSTEPPELSATPSISFTANRYTWKSAPLPELINFYFKRIDFSADPNPDEIWSWTAGGTQTTGGSSLGAPGQLPQLQGR